MKKVSIKAARVSAGYTQRDAAKALHIAPLTLSKWEKGLSEPKLSQYQDLCRLYGIEPTDTNIINWAE